MSKIHTQLEMILLVSVLWENANLAGTDILLLTACELY